MFRGGPSHPGIYPAAHLQPNVAGVQWRFQTDGAIRGSATIVGPTLYIGSTDGCLYAINRSTGEELWRFDASSPIGSTPAVAAGLVVMQSRDGTIHAVDARTGRPRWATRTGQVVPWDWGREGWDYYQSSPAISGDLVVVGAGDGNVYGLELRTGHERWRVPTQGRIRSSAAIANGTAFIGSADGLLYAIGIDSGRVRWTFRTAGADLSSREADYDRRTIVSSPNVTNGTVFFGSRDGAFYAVDAATGSKKWHIEHEGTSWGVVSPVVADSLVLGGTSDTGLLYALNIDSGRVVWRQTLNSWHWASPALSAGVVYAADALGWLHARQAATGATQWSFKLPAAIYASPVLADSVIYVGADDGALYAVLTHQGPAPRRAVFWDDSLRRVSSLGRGPGIERIAQYLEFFRGFERLNGTSLEPFMLERIRDSVPSVVVFAMVTPLPVMGVDGEPTSTFRRYLESGGKVVWLGTAPLTEDIDPATGALRAMRRDRSTRLLGVNHDSTEYGEYGAWLTDAGRCMGLPRQFTGAWAVAGDTVSIVLSQDERGRPLSWIREYGNWKGKGRGFVRLWPTTNTESLKSFAEIAEAGVTYPVKCAGQ